jgi:hypothetical protein
MAIQLSSTVRNQRLDRIEAAIGTSAVLKIRTGNAPATVGAADSGSVLATMQLASDWMSAAAAGAKAKLGTWSDTSADASGTAGHFRIYAVGGTVAHIQGTCNSSTGDLVIQNTSINSGQTVTVSSFTLTDGNA